MQAWRLLTIAVLVIQPTVVSSQVAGPVVCERKLQKVLVPEVPTYHDWQGGWAGRIPAVRMPVGSDLRFCAPNRRMSIELDGRLLWIDAFSVQVDVGSSALGPQPDDHDKTAGQRADASSTGPSQLAGTATTPTTEERAVVPAGRAREIVVAPAAPGPVMHSSPRLVASTGEAVAAADNRGRVASGGKYAVQIVVAPTESSAWEALRQMQSRYPKTLHGFVGYVVRAEVKGGEIFRGRFLAPSQKQGEESCKTLKRRGERCFVVRHD